MKKQAWDWACRCYAKRVCGMAPPETNRYQGDFDVQAVVSAAPIPKQLSEHRPCWAEMKRLFNEAWAEYEVEHVC